MHFFERNPIFLFDSSVDIFIRNARSAYMKTTEKESLAHGCKILQWLQ